MGTYKAYDELDGYLGDYAYGYSAETGIFDLALLVGAGFNTQGWDYIASVLSYGRDENGELYFLGMGVLDSGTLAAYKVSVSAVPVPTAVWLFGSGLIGLLGFAKRKARS